MQTEIAGTYYFRLENIVNGCEAIDSVVVMSNLSTPQINLDDEASLTCNQNSISVEGTIISANDFETKWLLNQEIIGNGTSQDISSQGNYIIEVTDLVSQCTTTDSIEVLPPNEIEALITSQVDLSCYENNAGEIQIIDVDGGTPNYEYSLNDAIIETTTVDGLAAGSYTLRVEDSHGCTYDTVVTLTQPTPIIADGNQEEYTVTKGEDVLINILTEIDTNNIVDVEWSPDIACEDCLSYSLSNVQANQDFQVLITDANGCQENIAFRINVDDNRIKLYLPNVINLGSETNGTFFPQTSESDLTIDELSIYDRWGNLVFFNQNFDINDPTAGWDGTVQDGPVEVGVYVYVVSWTSDGDTILEHGDLTVIR